MPTPLADQPHAARELEAAQLRRLEAASILEAMTLVLLVFVAVPLKHLAGWRMGVTVMGPVHGLAFLAYLWVALETVSGGGWSGKDIARLFIAALIPVAGFLNLRWLRRRSTDVSLRARPAR